MVPHRRSSSDILSTWYLPQSSGGFAERSEAFIGQEVCAPGNCLSVLWLNPMVKKNDKGQGGVGE